jgi:ribosomal protein S18 acetylase RimI-like enzyme
MTSEIRTPTKDEAAACARLLYLSGPSIYRFSFAASEAEVCEVLELYFAMPGALFSREGLVVEAGDDGPRGVLFAFPAPEMKRFARAMVKRIPALIAHSGLFRLVRTLGRLRLNRYFPIDDDDGLYLSNLAVFAQHRGQGVGVALLRHAEEMAKERGLDRLTLLVETDNPHAQHIYERFGFEVTKTVMLPESYRKHDLEGFRKMVKRSPPNSRR